MKKIIALILATIMVMLAVAACGGAGDNNTTTNGTTTNNTTTQATTTQATTQATTTTEKVVIPDPVDVVVYYTMGENPVAINVATNESAGKLTVAEGKEFELVQGNFYVATYYNGESKALADLGAALKTSGLVLGYNRVTTATSPRGEGKKPGGGWLLDISARPYTTNIYMDTAAMNTAMGDYSSIGHFGTLTVTEVVGGDIYFQSTNESVGEIGASDMNVIFAYVAYDGTVIKTATKKEATTPIANAVDLLRYANDTGHGKELGYTAKTVWQGVVDFYGYNNVTNNPCNCEVCGGKIAMQTHHTNLWLNNWQIPQVYLSALTNYNKTLVGEAALKTAMDEAKAALDTAVAANATVAALKAAAEAEGATEEAKKAYTDAIAADETLKALNTTYTSAKTVYENIDAYTERYNTWKPLYEKFCAAYDTAADLVLWDAEDVENSYLYKQLTAEGVDIATLKPTLTYFYDAAADTYTVYVTSLTDANVSTRLS